MLTPRKSLGQHFLRDHNIARKIVGLLGDGSQPIVEIGPGEGFLTTHILEKFSHVTAIEIDARAVELLRGNFPEEKLSLLHKDVRGIDFHSLPLWQKDGVKERTVVGNIPYNITSDILLAMFEARDVVTRAVIMMQKEVAKRLVAAPRTPEYGILSVYTRYYTMARIAFDVSAKCFYPPPKVVSSVVEFVMKPQVPLDEFDKKFRDVVRSSFGKRRKMLRNSLKFYPRTLRDFDSLPYLTCRAEELGVEEFLHLTKEIISREQP